MNTKITNAHIISLINVFNGFGDKKLPQRISYAISKNLKNLNKEYEFYQGELQKLLKNYSDFYEKDDDGNVKILPNGIPSVTPPHDTDFENELTELLSMETDVKLYKIDSDSFDYDDEKYDVLSPTEITNLMVILCEDDE